MTDKEVRKLSRKDLVEILYYLSRENEDLKAENEQLRSRLDQLVGEAIAAKHSAEPEVRTEDTSQDTAEKG